MGLYSLGVWRFVIILAFPHRSQLPRSFWQQIPKRRFLCESNVTESCRRHRTSDSRLLAGWPPSYAPTVGSIHTSSRGNRVSRYIKEDFTSLDIRTSVIAIMCCSGDFERIQRRHFRRRCYYNCAPSTLWYVFAVIGIFLLRALLTFNAHTHYSTHAYT